MPTFKHLGRLQGTCSHCDRKVREFAFEWDSGKQSLQELLALVED